MRETQESVTAFEGLAKQNQEEAQLQEEDSLGFQEPELQCDFDTITKGPWTMVIIFFSSFIPDYLQVDRYVHVQEHIWFT